METKNPILLILMLFIYQPLIFTQQLSLQKKHHDFGEIANLDFPPAVFEFRNTGKKPLAILMIQKSTEVKVHFERKYYQPGEKGIIQVTYHSNELGKFKEELTIVSNAQQSREKITIEGENVSVLECFPNKNNMNIRLVNVIDKITKKPVSEAEVELIYNKHTSVNFQVDKNGKKEQELEIGLYDIRILAPGYEKLENSIFLEKSVPFVFFELEPEKQNQTEGLPSEITEPNTTHPETKLPVSEYAENNIVLLVDVSLSMKNNNKLNLLKASMQNLVEALRDIDRVSIISYSSFPKVHLTALPGNQTQTIKNTIDSLSPQGITNGVRGLEKAFEIVEMNFMASGNNQIILATDGKFTGKNVSADAYIDMIRTHSQNGIILSIIGFGNDIEAVERMKEMVSIGNGTYHHVSSKEDIGNMMLEEIKNKSLITNH